MFARLKAAAQLRRSYFQECGLSSDSARLVCAANCRFGAHRLGFKFAVIDVICGGFFFPHDLDGETAIGKSPLAMAQRGRGLPVSPDSFAAQWHLAISAVEML